MALCVCGCGEEAGVLTRTRGAGYIKGEQRRFVRGHGRRGTRTTRVAAVQQYRNIRNECRQCKAEQWSAARG